MLIERKLLYVSDVASLVGVSSHRVYEWIHLGLLRAFKFPGSKNWHILVEDLEEFLQSQTFYDNKSENPENQSEGTKI